MNTYGGSHLMEIYGGLNRFLELHFPDTNDNGTDNVENNNRTSPTLGKSQKLLFKLIKELYPDTPVYCNYKHPEVY